METLKSVPGITVVLLLIIVVIWIFAAAAGFFEKDTYEYKAQTYKTSDNLISSNNLESGQQAATKQTLKEDSTSLRHLDKSAGQATKEAANTQMHEDTLRHSTQHSTALPQQSPKESPIPILKSSPQVKGVAFVSAAIKPLAYELDERFWGWRPNDIINVTDNVNNFQLGVLEITRRTVVILAERISRTGSSAAF
nr:hypothetical protein [Desulfobacterales bacterium]